MEYVNNGVSIVVPCYNESANLRKNMEKLMDFLDTLKIEYELILVNDGSKDSTLLVMDEITTLNPSRNIIPMHYGSNRGKGYATRLGLSKASYGKVFFMDADLSTDINHIPEFANLLDSHNIVIGSRKKPGDNIIEKQTPFRVFVGKSAKLITSAIIDLDFYDTQCGFKAFRKDVLDDILPELTIDEFCFDVEILYVAKLLGYGFLEVPVNWKNDPNSSVNPIKDGIKFARDLLLIRKSHRRG